MNAYELADDVKNISNTIEALEWVQKATPMLRQQADRIAELEKQLQIKETVYAAEPYLSDWAKRFKQQQTKPLSDEEIENLLRQSIWALGLNTDWTEDENWADAITVFRAIIERHEGKENE